MDSALFWIDMITNPMFATWFGLLAGIAMSLMVTGVAGIMTGDKPRQRSLMRVFFFTFLLVTVTVWILNFGLIVWYNTPLGPPLEIVK